MFGGGMDAQAELRKSSFCDIHVYSRSIKKAYDDEATITHHH